ncbi:MAG TPA: NAD(P)(+) transhydrogenase (Re/Si-specific) subunit beta, partial [Saprospiraceae bacterium]|nr:NAD(P)(+) transhydrogenase (Re/Si-specific) subunit beta [Saprospiraceae bacterium]
GAVQIVWGLKLQSSPDTARRGNIIAAIGMGLAILGTFFTPIEGASNNYLWIMGGLGLSAVVGYQAAMKVKMTGMPQMVSLFNGLGGACAVILSMIEFYHYYYGAKELSVSAMVITLFTLFFGGIAFTGSMLAYAKLEGYAWSEKLALPRHHLVNMALLALSLVLMIFITINDYSIGFEYAVILMILSLVYGVSFVAPIGGADMPVVISLLNSFTGLTAASTGLIYDSQIMLLGGILVGAAGTILTVLMCEAMNRSLLNVLIGGFGGSSATSGAAKATGDQVIKEVTLNDAAIQLYYANSVMFVPGYGLAVAQAQKVCKELDDLLESNGVSVKYAIHPVAGRMPGHMNVLLAEADVPYPKLLDLDDANGALPNTDVVVIVGANDVVNPAAKTDPGSPIYGMPVLNVWEAKNVIVMKRSMRSGYAGIDNPLFFHERARMLFGDAKESLQKLVAEVKAL